MAPAKSQKDQIAAIKARIAEMSKPSTGSSPQQQTPPSPAIANLPPIIQEQARSHFMGQVEHLIAERTIEKIPVKQIAPNMQPDMRQIRMIPLPEALVVDGEVVPIYRELVEELYALGLSLKERQLQPIVVYPGSSEHYPEARYLLLVGQRRWTAMQLVGLETIDAVVIDPPTPLERIRLQYAENDAREDFSDMERAWALWQLRQTMGGDSVPINEVVASINIKRSRAYQLLRLLAFTPEQQQTIVLLRLQERQMLSLTDAFHQGKLSSSQVDSVLQRLRAIATERSLESQRLATTETTQTTDSPRRSGIDAATVARIVAQEMKQESAPKISSPRWYTSLRDEMSRVARHMRRAAEHADDLSTEETEILLAELSHLQNQVQSLIRGIMQGAERSNAQMPKRLDA